MLSVHSAPAIESQPQGGWDLTFWLGDACDYSIPFRNALNEIARLLGEQPGRALDMPPYHQDEDFVEGGLRFETHEIGG